MFLLTYRNVYALFFSEMLKKFLSTHYKIFSLVTLEIIIYIDSFYKIMNDHRLYRHNLARAL